jgi:hypothetical protein
MVLCIISDPFIRFTRSLGKNQEGMIGASNPNFATTKKAGLSFAPLSDYSTGLLFVLLSMIKKRVHFWFSSPLQM